MIQRPSSTTAMTPRPHGNSHRLGLDPVEPDRLKVDANRHGGLLGSTNFKSPGIRLDEAGQEEKDRIGRSSLLIAVSRCEASGD
jgi:hypothetical protein